MTHGIIYSKRGFYVGDICYAMPDEIYKNCWIDAQGCENGVFFIPSEISGIPDGCFFAVASTAWGDGCYTDNAGRRYPVDAGVIGVLPLELVDFNRYTDDGHIFCNPGICTFTANAGKFTIEIPDGELITIDTND